MRPSSTNPRRPIMSSSISQLPYMSETACESYPTPPLSISAYDSVSDPTMGASHGFTDPIVHDEMAEVTVNNNNLLPTLTSSYSGPSVVPSFDPKDDTEDTEDTEDIISISTSFNLRNLPQSDTILLSSDNVWFYVHWATINAACSGIFKDCLSSAAPKQSSATRLIHLDTPASQLNVILHALHDTSPAANSPDFDTLAASLDHMPRYGMTPQHFIQPSKPIFDLLLSYAPLRPLDLYALAAFHSIHNLCVAASSHLLSIDLFSIADPVAERIGAVYLKRLMLLHFERSKALRNVLMAPPHPHPPTKLCNFENQRKITRAWALAGAYLVWDAKPDLSTYTIKKTFNPLLGDIDCKECRETMQDRIKDVLSQWVAQKASKWPPYFSLYIPVGLDIRAPRVNYYKRRRSLLRRSFSILLFC